MRYPVLFMVYTRKMFRSVVISVSFVFFLLGCSNEEQNVLEVSTGEQFREGVHYEIVDKPTTVRDPLKD